MKRFRRDRSFDRHADEAVELTKPTLPETKASQARNHQTPAAVLTEREYGQHPSGFYGLIEVWDEHPAHAIERFLRGEL